MKKVRVGTCIYRMNFACFLAFIVTVRLYHTCLRNKTFFGGVARGYGGCEASRPAVLQMSWAARYQVYVTWDYPRWHPLKANSQQYSWGGIWWRVCVCVCVGVCVHAFRLVVTFGRVGLSAGICCVIGCYTCSHYIQSETFSINWRNVDQADQCRGWGQRLFERVW